MCVLSVMRVGMFICLCVGVRFGVCRLVCVVLCEFFCVFC